MKSKQSVYIQGIKTVGYRQNLAKEKKTGETEMLLITACYYLALAGYGSLEKAWINDETQTLEQFS
jgi:hypothetical protein